MADQIGGASGNATAADLLSGYTATVASGPITGSMANNGRFDSGSPGVYAGGYYSSVSVPGIRTMTADPDAVESVLGAYDSTNNLTYGIEGYPFTSDTRSFSVSSNSWTAQAASPQARGSTVGGFDSSAGLIYAILGGSSATSYMNNNEIYSPSGNSWSSGASAPTALTNGQGNYNPSTNLTYLIAGENGAAYTGCDTYSHSSNSYTAIASYPAAMYDGVSVYDSTANLTYGIDGNVYGGASSPVSNCYSYSSSSNAWTAIASDIGTSASHGGAFNVGENLTFRVDGSGSQPNFSGTNPVISMYSQTNNTWTRTSYNDSASRQALRAVYDSTAQLILATGGYSSSYTGLNNEIVA